MKETLIGTIVTYTVTDDDVRATLVEILEGLGYEDGNDQSTMIHQNRIPAQTLNAINDYCSVNDHEFMTGDVLVIYSAVETEINGERRLRIQRRQYRFSMIRNSFV